MDLPRDVPRATLSAAILGAILFVAVSQAFALNDDFNIDPDGQGYRYAWSENYGWIDFGTTEGNVEVDDTALTGWAWGENVGWISLNCSNTDSCATADYKVSNNGAGYLSGYAWSENLGWIDFDPAGATGVRIDGNGDFSGWAWGENVGWISLNCSNTDSCATADYKVKTSWTLDGAAPDCGNGTLDDGEECDDGNGTAGDGCSDLCVVEDGYVCTNEPMPSECSRSVQLATITVLAEHQSMTVQVTVAGSAEEPASGAALLLSGDTEVADVTIGNGSGSVTVTGFDLGGMGRHELTVQYLGNAQHPPGTSEALSVWVFRLPSTDHTIHLVDEL